MRSRSIVALCIAGALATGAVAAANASAAPPEYKACGKAKKLDKKYTGKYNNKLCTEVNAGGEGKYERVVPKFPVKFKSKSGETKIYLYKPAEHKIESEVPCKTDKDEGEITSSTEGKVTITYEGCIVPITGKFPGPCQSAGEPEGVVKTPPLDTKLVWLNEAETEAGIALAPAESMGLFQEAACAAGKVVVKQYGSLVGKITPMGEPSKLLTVTFSASSMTGEQAFSGYWEGGLFVEDKLISDISGLVSYENVPTGLNSIEPQKGKALLIS